MLEVPKVLRKFGTYVDGKGYLGICDECELPKIAIKKEDIRGGGMDGSIPADMGLEPLSSMLNFLDMRPELFKHFGLIDGKDVKIALRGAQGIGPTTDTIIADLQGGFSEIDPGSWKAGDKPGNKFTADLKYYRLRINGKTAFEIDFLNNKRVIGGVDQLAEQRKALGL